MEQNRNISCIILNYNDAGTTEKLVNQIRGYEILDSIVIVDNCSSDHSPEILGALEGGKVHLICTEKNGGYGYGNNQGIRYAVSELHATHVLIANPDVEVSESCIRAMAQAFSEFDRLAVSAAVTVNPAGEVQLSSWRLCGFWGDLLDTGLITRRLFKKLLNDRPELTVSHMEPPGGSERPSRSEPLSRSERPSRSELPSVRCSYAFADAVAGSLFLADAAALMECGLYDEEVFLYCEEKILGCKLKKAGYRTVLLLDQRYVHHHSVSISRNVKSIRKKQELLHRSKLHYYKNYLKINPFEEWLAKCALRFLLAEISFLTEVLGMSWET